MDPEVEDYYDKVHRQTWGRRSAGMLTGGTIGAAYGAVVGAAASALPFVLGALGAPGAELAVLPSLSAVASSAALFAGVAGTFAVAVTADVGANAASISAGLAEKERREKLQNPAKETTPKAAEKEQPKEKAPALFNWKAAALAAGLFAAFGAILALNPITASTIALLGFKAGSTAAVAASAAVFGMFGTFIGLKNSLITNKISNFYMKVFVGSPKEPSKEQEVAAPVAPEKTQEPAPEIQTEKSQSKFANAKPRFSLQALILKKTDCGCSHENTPSR